VCVCVCVCVCVRARAHVSFGSHMSKKPYAGGIFQKKNQPTTLVGFRMCHMQCVVVCCSVWQCVVVNKKYRVNVSYHMQCVAMRCSVSQCVAAK